MRNEIHKGAEVKQYDAIVADNTNCVITVAADADHAWSLLKLMWSYDANPDADAGNILVAIGGTTVLDLDITVGGPGELDFGTTGGLNKARPMENKNEAMVITLNAGGTGVMGKLFALVK